MSLFVPTTTPQADGNSRNRPFPLACGCWNCLLKPDSISFITGSYGNTCCIDPTGTFTVGGAATTNWSSTNRARMFHVVDTTLNPDLWYGFFVSVDPTVPIQKCSWGWESINQSISYKSTATAPWYELGTVSVGSVGFSAIKICQTEDYIPAGTTTGAYVVCLKNVRIIVDWSPGLVRIGVEKTYTCHLTTNGSRVWSAYTTYLWHIDTSGFDCDDLPVTPTLHEIYLRWNLGEINFGIPSGDSTQYFFTTPIYWDKDATNTSGVSDSAGDYSFDPCTADPPDIQDITYA